MRKTLAEYAKTDGDYGYEDEQGCWHENAKDLLQIGILGFCGCGNAESNLLYVLRGLELVEELHSNTNDDWDRWHTEYTAHKNEHFKSIEAEQFFVYWCDKEGLTEHGISVFCGSLTEKGQNLLSMLREWRDLRQSTPPE